MRTKALAAAGVAVFGVAVSSGACASGTSMDDSDDVPTSPPDQDGDIHDGGDGGDGGAVSWETGARSSCVVGGCNAAGGACASAAQGCYCTTDAQCKSGKCVKSIGTNDVSCTSCSGAAPADGFNCQLASPGIPAACSNSFAYVPAHLTASQFAGLASGGAVNLGCSGTLEFNGASWSGATCGQTLPVPSVLAAPAGGAAIDVLAFESLTVGAGIELKLTGKNAVMLVVFGDATVDGTVHADGAPGVASRALPGTSGPGGNVSCTGSTGVNGDSSHTSGGGGGGASAPGGRGGNGVGGIGGASGGVSASPGTGALRGGCPGGTSGAWACTVSGGGGGGAVQISAAGTLTIGGTVTANGGAGGTSSAATCLSKGCAPGPNRTYGAGGGGGGSGGAIVLEGARVSTATATLTADGGGGGAPNTAIQQQGRGGSGGTASTPVGGDGTGSVVDGCGADDQSGGGGGGAYGYVLQQERGAVPCETSLTPAPVCSAARTCLCVDDSNCSSGKCVDAGGQCTGVCTGSGAKDDTGCQVLVSAPR
jgi:hypothetical protein